MDQDQTERRERSHTYRIDQISSDVVSIKVNHPEMQTDALLDGLKEVAKNHSLGEIIPISGLGKNDVAVTYALIVRVKPLSSQ